MADAAPSAVSGTSTTPGSPSTNAPSNSPIPLATGDYATAAATATAAYQQALASINNQRQQALQTFGYTGTIDPTTGQLTNMQVDPNNPYGQYQQMLHQGALDEQGVVAGSAARGLGSVYGARGGGLAAQSLDNAQLAFGANSASLGEGLMNTLGGLTDQQNQAADTMNNALWQAELASAQNAIGNQDFNPADFTGITSSAPGGTATPAPTTTYQTKPAPTNTRTRTGNTFHTAATARTRVKNGGNRRGRSSRRGGI